MAADIIRGLAKPEPNAGMSIKHLLMAISKVLSVPLDFIYRRSNCYSFPSSHAL
jgi:hypothetical protein